MGNLTVDVLLGVGVAAQLVCCVGVLALRNTFDRLHYAAAGSTVGPFCIVAAVLVREGFGSTGLDAIAAVAILFVANPALITATARAARRIDGRDGT